MPARRPAWLAGGKWPSWASFVGGDGSFRGLSRACAFSPEWNLGQLEYTEYTFIVSTQPMSRVKSWTADRSQWTLSPEPVFINLSRRPGIYSQPPDGPGGTTTLYMSYRPARLHTLAESVARNRFLGSLNVYKYRLWYGTSREYLHRQSRGKAIRSSLPFLRIFFSTLQELSSSSVSLVQL